MVWSAADGFGQLIRRWYAPATLKKHLIAACLLALAALLAQRHNLADAVGAQPMVGAALLHSAEVSAQSLLCQNVASPPTGRSPTNSILPNMVRSGEGQSFQGDTVQLSDTVQLTLTCLDLAAKSGTALRVSSMAAAHWSKVSGITNTVSPGR